MRYVTLNDSSCALPNTRFSRFRNTLIAKGLPTEDVNALLLKLYKQKHSIRNTPASLAGAFLYLKNERRLVLITNQN